jgi:hypothetical protein
MQMLQFMAGYLWDLLWGWLGLAFLVLGLNDVSEKFFHHSFQAVSKRRWQIVIVLLIVAQGAAYHDLWQQQSRASQDSKQTPIIIPESPNAELCDKLNKTENDIRRRDDEIAKLKGEIDRLKDTKARERARSDIRKKLSEFLNTASQLRVNCLQVATFPCVREVCVVQPIHWNTCLRI